MKGPALDGCPEAASSNFEMGQTTTHASRGLLQVQPDKSLGKKLPFTSLAARTLSTMWPEWTLEDNCPLSLCKVGQSSIPTLNRVKPSRTS
jgi:hypothetical protein